MGFDLGVDALLGPADEGIPFFDIGIDTAISTCPIRMLTKQADPSRDKNIHVATSPE
jgi:hypothetical protein